MYHRGSRDHSVIVGVEDLLVEEMSIPDLLDIMGGNKVRITTEVLLNIDLIRLVL